MRATVHNVGLHLMPESRREKSKIENLSAYRSYTRALLRRYFRMSVDIGRLPSVLGGLCFRARVSSYQLHTFEDAVIFVHDIERTFEQLDRRFLEIIAGVVLLEYSIPEAALRLGISPQCAARRYYAAVDSLSAILLEAGLLLPVFESATGEPGNPARPLISLPPRKPPVSERIRAAKPIQDCVASGRRT